MNVSDKLLNTVTEPSESYKQFPYNDGFGNMTVGYGHRILPGEDFSKGINRPDAIILLRKDMTKAENIVNREVTVVLNQGEFDALCDAVFNMGDFLKASTLLRMLNAGATDEAKQQLQRWDMAGGKHLTGLHARRIKEMDLWTAGDGG